MENRPKTVILNSRQGRRPVGNDPWIVSTARAVQAASLRGCTILTSVGISGFELPLFLAARDKLSQKIFIPLGRGETIPAMQKFCSEQFCLVEETVEWRVIEIGESANDPRDLPLRRDRLILNEADIVYPVSIRPGGNMERLLFDISGQKIVEDSFRVPYQAAPRHIKLEIEPQKVNREMDALLDNYLIHWTKSSHTPWPGERWCDYYEAIVQAIDTYPRSGLDTLCRILEERKIRASFRHHRKGFPAVAFSALKPSEAAGLMQWRARFQEMTFEPYGIAVEKKLAAETGIKKVFYGHPDMYRYLEEEHKPYFQSIGIRGFWMPEKEYRHIGEFDLRKIPNDKLMVIVWREEEKEKISDLFGGTVLSLYR
ncbi:MAG: hypothetical protein NT002_14255 [candidate division Zixibacteria bacterium]|nr:hypothetical protein [candidate division Zixibacteria bacterium]